MEKIILILCLGLSGCSDPIKQNSCDEITEGIFGDRLCGYNIEYICKERGTFVTPTVEEVYICNKYFKIKNNGKN